MLRAFGKEMLAAIPPEVPADVAEIPAIGPCIRPTDEQRAAITKRLGTKDPIRFGCVEPAGTIVDLGPGGGEGGVRYGAEAPDLLSPVPRGPWRVVRVEPRRIVTIDSYRRRVVTDWRDSDFWKEVSLTALVLVDLDGDGSHDVVLANTQFDGSNKQVTLSSWLSRTNKRRSLDTLSGLVSIARGQQFGPGQPVVIQIDHRHRWGEPPNYRCLEPDGTLDQCAAIEGPRRLYRSIEVAGWFVNGREYGPNQTRVPDRDLLARLLDEIGAPAAARPALLASVPATSTELRVAAEIARAVTPREVPFGELGDTPRPADPRSAELMQLLGDTPCAPASRTAQAIAVRKIAAWGAAQRITALVEHGDCVKGNPCPFSQHRPVEVFGSCVAGSRGYYAVRLGYADSDQELIARDGVFFLDGKGVSPIAVRTDRGLVRPLGQRGGPPEPQQTAKFHRNAETLVAITIDSEGVVTVAADGVTVNATTPSGASWYPFETAAKIERDCVSCDEIRTTPPTAANVVQATVANGERLELWHWDGTWNVIATLPTSFDATMVPRGAVETWFWTAQRKDDAFQRLRAFSPGAWAGDAAVRANLEKDLALIGADPQVIARVAAAAATMP